MTNIQKNVAEEKIPGIDSIIHDLELCCTPGCNCKDCSRNKLPKEVDCAIYLCIDALEALKKARELLAEKPSQASNSTDENNGKVTMDLDELIKFVNSIVYKALQNGQNVSDDSYVDDLCALGERIGAHAKSIGIIQGFGAVIGLEAD